MDNDNTTTPSASGQVPATPSAGQTPPSDDDLSLDSSVFATPTAPVAQTTSATPGQTSPVAPASPSISATHTNPPIPATPLTPVVSPASIGPVQTPPQPQVSATASAAPARNLSGNPSPEDIDLIRAYVGINYDKIFANRFSWTGFFFGSCYLVYRKTYGYACLLFLVQIVLLFSLSYWLFTSYGLIFLASIIADLLVSLADLLIRVLYGLLTNKIYLRTVKRKVAKIKAANPTVPHEELKTICAAKGGTSIPAAVIAVPVTIFGAIFIVAILFAMSISI